MSDDTARITGVPELSWRMTPVSPGTDESGLLVLLASPGDTVAHWEPTVAALRDAGSPVRILRIDLSRPTSVTHPDPTAVHDVAVAVVDAVDRVGGGRFWVAGTEQGGWIALALALSFPERVRGVGMFLSDARASGTPFDRAAVLGRVRVPAMVIGGTADELSPSIDLLALADALPLGDYCEVPGSADRAPVDFPREAAALLGELVGANSLVHGG
jgi:pimeloyl-ACP methyl ester carboxylesterase